MIVMLRKSKFIEENRSRVQSLAELLATGSGIDILVGPDGELAESERPNRDDSG